MRIPISESQVGYVREYTTGFYKGDWYFYPDYYWLYKKERMIKMTFEEFKQFGNSTPFPTRRVFYKKRPPTRRDVYDKLKNN